MTDIDVDVTVLRGQPSPATQTALDRLALTLPGDWVVIISCDDTHLIARPADSPAAGLPPQRPSEAPLAPEPPQEAKSVYPPSPDAVQPVIEHVPGYGYTLRPLRLRDA